MSDLVIETRALRKVFGSPGRRIAAVDGLDLEVPAGGVHGFLGPNGSGKTTTIRLLLGLARPTSGEMRLFGLKVPAQLPQVMDRIGRAGSRLENDPDVLVKITEDLELSPAGRMRFRADAHAFAEGRLEAGEFVRRTVERQIAYEIGRTVSQSLAETVESV